jgi:hypothetical protein
MIEAGTLLYQIRVFWRDREDMWVRYYLLKKENIVYCAVIPSSIDKVRGKRRIVRLGSAVLHRAGENGGPMAVRAAHTLGMVVVVVAVH